MPGTGVTSKSRLENLAKARQMKNSNRKKGDAVTGVKKSVKQPLRPAKTEPADVGSTRPKRKSSTLKQEPSVKSKPESTRPKRTSSAKKTQEPAQQSRDNKRLVSAEDDPTLETLADEAMRNIYDAETAEETLSKENERHCKILNAVIKESGLSDEAFEKLLADSEELRLKQEELTEEKRLIAEKFSHYVKQAKENKTAMQKTMNRQHLLEQEA
jgi:hypothetical protein